jgi:hypothetical protein
MRRLLSHNWWFFHLRLGRHHRRDFREQRFDQGIGAIVE